MPERILHQTWKSKNSIPENFRFWRKSFLSINKNLEYKIYDDEDNERLFLSKAPGLSDLYRQFPAEIYRVDIVRALYLFCFGGLYADMDFQCLRPLDDIFESESDVILGRMGTNKNFAHSIPNAWMASNKHQGFWLGYLDEVHRRWGNRESLPTIRPEHVTGPIALKSTALRYQNEPANFRERVLSFIERLDLDIGSSQIKWGNLEVLPGHIVYPINWNDSLHNKFRHKLKSEKGLLSIGEARDLFPSSLAVTYWAHSWEEVGEHPKDSTVVDRISSMVRGILNTLKS